MLFERVRGEFLRVDAEPRADLLDRRTRGFLQNLLTLASQELQTVLQTKKHTTEQKTVRKDPRIERLR